MNNEELLQAFSTAFIDKQIQSNVGFKSQFISNNYREGKKVISAIEKELNNCDEFFISVAFITMSGITPLLQTFKQLEKKGIKGQILTTDYLNFSEPNALEKLSELKNITIKMYKADSKSGGFHTKGYLFRKGDIYRIIIGSSNLTQNALTQNQEWNMRIVSTQSGELAENIMTEYASLWNSENSTNYADYAARYRYNYELIKEQRRQFEKKQIELISHYRMIPNSMQQGFISRLKELVSSGAKRALLISATGTGKTYASAFALRDLNPKRALFLVHREQIAKQAMASYQRVFGSDKSMGLLSGNSKDFSSDFIFSTIQMMSRKEIMSLFSQRTFEIIVIDEAHRVGGNSYQNIIDYFDTKLLLGMTASPERTDTFDVFNVFDHNIAYEIRLKQALEEDLLCPFHYFGITDLQIKGKNVDDQSRLQDFAFLTSDDRVNHIIEQVSYYGFSGDRVKGLMFCSTKREAKILSDKFNEKGYQTIALTGEDSQQVRENAIEKLVSDNADRLDYIITVDIFNEGVDVPEINQVVLLRPTESPIIFVQQLGRGLRKANNKEYVVILDFIGNYKNNFMIPIALSGDRSYNKDTIRHHVAEGDRIIPGASTIHFDEIAKERIFKSIDIANLNGIRLIRESYSNLKDKLGRIPRQIEFDEYDEIDLLKIFENKNLGSYYHFLVKYEKDYTIRLSSSEATMISFISKKFANGKRIHELALIQLMLTNESKLMEQLQRVLKTQYQIEITNKEINNIVNIMTNQFQTGSGRGSIAECILLEKESEGEDYRRSEVFSNMVKNKDFYHMVEEIIEFGIHRYKTRYSNSDQDLSFVLYQKYTYEDVCRLLNWRQNIVSLNIGGYKYDKETNTFPVFINYHKAEDIQESIKYEDRFLSPNKLVSISKQGRTLKSKDIQIILSAQERNITIPLFVRKNKDDKISNEFYYLGKMTPTGCMTEFKMKATDKNAVEIEWLLEVPVREDIYEYIVEE